MVGADGPINAVVDLYAGTRETKIHLVLASF
jgi:hypothetical protein